MTKRKHEIQMDLFDNKAVAVYEYGLRYRPAGYGTVPDGRVGERPDPGFPNYGVVQYARPLTTEEISTFELEPVTRNEQ